MNKKIIILLVVLFFTTSFAFNALAEENKEEILKAKISLSKDIGKCAPDKGKGVLPIVWRGVSDKRAEKEVGILKKGKDEFQVVSEEPIEKIIGTGIEDLLKRCGYTVVSAPKGIDMSVDLNELFSGAKKGIIIGETEAKGSMTIHLAEGIASYNLDYSASKQDKGLRKKNIRRLESSLGEVLAMMIADIAGTSQFENAVKELSK